MSTNHHAQIFIIKKRLILPLVFSPENNELRVIWFVIRASIGF